MQCIEHPPTPRDQPTVRLMLSTTRLECHPRHDTRLWAVINGEIEKNQVEVSLGEFAEAACRGHAWSPAVFHGGKRNNKSWVHQRIFALDFDGGLTPDLFLARADALDIHPVLIYPTYSHTPNNPRFRVVFLCDQLITDIRLRNLIQTLLMDVFTFPEAGPDSNCKDAARMFLGTNHEPMHTAFHETFNPIDLLNCLADKLREDQASDFETRYNKLLLRFGLDGEPVKLWGNFNNDASTVIRKDFPLHTFFYLKAPTEKTSSCQSESIIFSPSIRYAVSWHQKKKAISTRLSESTPVESTKNITKKRLTEGDKKALVRHCRLCREFITGASHVDHENRRRLLTNLIQRECGLRWFRKGLAARQDYTADNLIADAKKYEWKPEGCAGCPYESECIHHTNLLQQIPAKKRERRQIAPSWSGKPVEEVRVHLREAIRDCLQASDGRIHVIKCDTGIGKTQELLQGALGSACIAFPTHRLKEEAYTRYRRQSPAAEAYLWQARPRLPEPYESQLQRINEAGLTGTQGIMDRALKDPAVAADDDLFQELIGFRQSLKDIHSQQLIFTTHEKAHHLQSHSRFVFDEDFLSSLIKVQKVEISDLRYVLDSLGKLRSQTACKALSNHLAALLRIPAGSALALTGVSVSSSIAKELTNIVHHCNGPVLPLLSAKALMKLDGENLYCISRRHLLPNATYVVLSATADQRLYEELFGERLRFLDLSGAERKGKLFLHTARGYTRTGIGEDIGAFVNQVKADQAHYGFQAVITYKFLEEYLRKAGIEVAGTFGGLCGLDTHGGRNLAVYGTPHPPEYVYKLYAAMLGWKVAPDDFQFDERSIIRNEFEFSFTTCSAVPRLLDLQLGFIEAELEQAVGRARLVNHENEVHVFSSFPLRAGVLC